MSSTLYHVIYIIPCHLHYTISSTLYHVIYIIPCHLYYTMSSTLYHVIYSIPCNLHYTMSSTLYHVIYIIPCHLHVTQQCSLQTNVSSCDNVSTTWYSESNKTHCDLYCAIFNGILKMHYTLSGV